MRSSRFDDLRKPLDLEPPLTFAARGLNEVIFSDDVLHAYEQTEAVALGLASHPNGSLKDDPLVPVFGMDESERKVLAKAQKVRDEKRAGAIEAHMNADAYRNVKEREEQLKQQLVSLGRKIK